MELRIGDRYQLFHAIQSLDDGVLYAGKDLILQRDVMIYVFNKEAASNTEELHRLFGQASRYSHESFFHVLNAGAAEQYVYAVFASYTGQPLLESLHHTLTGKEILMKIFELGTSIQHAMEEQVMGYSVTAENIWLTGNNQLKVMNYWSAAEEGRHGASGLAMLLIQLCSRSTRLPQSMEWLQDVLHLSMADLTVTQKEMTLALLQRVFGGDHSLLNFMIGLRDILEMSGSNFTLNHFEPKHEDQDKKPQPYEDMDEYETDWEDEPDKKSASRLPVIAGVLCALVFFAVTLFIVFSLPSKSEPGSASSDPAISTPTPEPSGDTPSSESNPPSNVPTPTPPSTQQPESNVTPTPKPSDVPVEQGGAPLSVPNLIGLKQEEAERQLLAAGLHYDYFIVNTEEQKKGLVFKQEPEADVTVNKEDRVKFWVSRDNGGDEDDEE